MKRLGLLRSTVPLLLLLLTAESYATPFADEVFENNPGPFASGSAAGTLGPQDGIFYALGRSGSVTLRFLIPIADEAGNDLAVWQNLEIYSSAEISVSENGVDFTPVGVAPPGSPLMPTSTEFDLAGTGLVRVYYVKVADRGEDIGNGFNLDAVEALHFSEAPEVIEISDSSVDFGAVCIGRSAVASLSVTNLSSSDLEVEIQPPPAGAFTLLTVSPVMLGQGESEEIQVGFEPPAEGEFDASLGLSVLEGGEVVESFPVPLSGQGVATEPFFEMDQAFLDLGTVTVPDEETGFFSIRNIAGQPIMVHLETTDGAFRVSPADGEIDPDELLVASVVFEPNREALFQGNVTVSATVEGCTYSSTILLQGQGDLVPIAFGPDFFPLDLGREWDYSRIVQGFSDPYTVRVDRTLSSSLRDMSILQKQSASSPNPSQESYFFWAADGLHLLVDVFLSTSGVLGTALVHVPDQVFPNEWVPDVPFETRRVSYSLIPGAFSIATVVYSRSTYIGMDDLELELHTFENAVCIKTGQILFQLRPPASPAVYLINRKEWFSEGVGLVGRVESQTLYLNGAIQDTTTFADLLEDFRVP
jgi:hypothetical protein